MRTSSTTQPGSETSTADRKSSALPKVRTGSPIEPISLDTAVRSDGSSSTTKTVGSCGNGPPVVGVCSMYSDAAIWQGGDPPGRPQPCTRFASCTVMASMGSTPPVGGEQPRSVAVLVAVLAVSVLLGAAASDRPANESF